MSFTHYSLAADLLAISLKSSTTVELLLIHLMPLKCQHMDANLFMHRLQHLQYFIILLPPLKSMRKLKCVLLHNYLSPKKIFLSFWILQNDYLALPFKLRSDPHKLHVI